VVLVRVTGEETARRWVLLEDFWVSVPYDGSLECSDLVKYLPRDLTNEAAILDDRLKRVTGGIFIVCDLLGVDEAEVI
jgi:hypothetical protein